MTLPKPEEAPPAGALTHLTGDGCLKTAERLSKMGWQAHWPHSSAKPTKAELLKEYVPDYFEYSLPARLELAAANPALLLDLPEAADAAAVKAAATVFGEVREVLRPAGTSFAFVHFASDGAAARCVAELRSVGGAAVRAQPAKRQAAEVAAWRAGLARGGRKAPSPDGSWEMVQPAAA